MSFTANTVTSSPGPDPQTPILKERAASKFDPTKMHYFLEGSKEESELFKSLTQQMERDPVLSVDSSNYDLTKDQQREVVAQKINRLARYIEHDTPAVLAKRTTLVGVFDPQLGTRIGINLGLFLACVRGNGSPAQVKYWSSTKETNRVKGIYGCFGMTELAHGSNVAGLETTATFDQENDEFIINTPHIGATKWWIGGAAHSATHCSVYARLVVKGKDYGVKTFVVPLRDSNHDVNPGVTVGDIGAKMGRDGIDNGWIQFSNVRIPRFFMLQRFCTVSADGDVVLPPLEQLSYSALLGGRVSMVLDSYRIAARMTTIALRYAIGRRQFGSKKGSLETQLLDYPLHQKRLLPYLALAYVISAGAIKIEKTIDDTLAELDVAVQKNDIKVIMKAIESMKSLFIDSGSLKSTCTWLGSEVIDNCRQACGGHGYSAYSGFGKAYNDWVVQCTWEGDNSVLGMSVGKPVIKHVSSVVDKGAKVKGSSSFLSAAKDYVGANGDKVVLKSLDDLNDLKKFLHGIEVAIIRLAHEASKTVKEQNGNYDYVGGDMVTLSKLKAHHYLLQEFIERVENHDDKELVPYLTMLGQLYASGIVFEKFAGVFLTFNVATTQLVGQLSSIQIPQLCQTIRPHVVAFTDSFQLSDMLVNSAIGKYDGNIYENYFKIVKDSNPPSVTKAPYSAALENMLNRPSLEARERYEKSAEAAEVLSG